MRSLIILPGRGLGVSLSTVQTRRLEPEQGSVEFVRSGQILRSALAVTPPDSVVSIVRGKPGRNIRDNARYRD